MTRRLLFLVATLTLTACTAPLQGPQVDLATIATPDQVPSVVRAVPPLPPGPTPQQGQFRAWVPREVSPNGDVSEGHWITVSTTPPAVEVLEPVTPMPRAPRVHLGQKPAAQAQPQVPAQPQMVPQATATPVLPTGLLRGQASPVRSILGGQ